MGNKNSVQTHTDFADVATNYSYEVKYTDKRFGEIKLLKKKGTGDKIFQKDYTSNSASEFEETIKGIQKRIPQIHPNLIKILGYNSKKEDFFCADFYKISLFFESFETDLEKEIAKRAPTKKYFTENELKCLLDSIATAGAFLQKNEIAHGDIRPFNIFITRNKDYKLCDNSLFHPVYYPSHIGVLDSSEIKAHLPSPQVFKNYKAKEKKNTDYDPYKNDVYGLGLSVLMAAQLGKVDNLQNFDKKEINKDAINKSLQGLEERYSQDFVETLRILLHPEEANRPNFIEIDNEMQFFRADIRAQATIERNLEIRREEEEQQHLQQQHQQQEQEQNKSDEYEYEADQKYAAPPQKSSPTTVTSGNPSPLYIDDEIDKRVRLAVEKSEGAVNRSPSKYKNDVIDQCINTYLQREPFTQDKPLLYTISPYLTMERRFVPTLRVYSQDNQRLQASSYNVADVSNMYGSLATAATNYPHKSQAFYVNQPGQVSGNYGEYRNVATVTEEVPEERLHESRVLA